MVIRRHQIFIFPLLAAISFARFAEPARSATGDSNAVLQYPETRRVDQVDDYHGVKVRRSVSLAGE